MVVYPIKCTIKYFLLLAYVYCLHLMLSWACYIIANAYYFRLLCGIAQAMKCTKFENARDELLFLSVAP